MNNKHYPWPYNLMAEVFVKLEKCLEYRIKGARNVSTGRRKKEAFTTADVIMKRPV